VFSVQWQYSVIKFKISLQKFAGLFIEFNNPTQQFSVINSDFNSSK